MRARLVREVMTSDPVCVNEETTLDEAVALMDARHVAQLPVVCGATVIGVISRGRIAGGSRKANVFDPHAIARPDRLGGMKRKDSHADKTDGVPDDTAAVMIRQSLRRPSSSPAACDNLPRHRNWQIPDSVDVVPGSGVRA